MLAIYLSYAEFIYSSCVDWEELMIIVHASSLDAAAACSSRHWCLGTGRSGSYAGKATGAHRGGLVPAGQSVAWHAPGCARVAARPQAQVQRRAPANTPDLRHHINDIFIVICCDFMMNLFYTIYVIYLISLFSVYLYLIIYLIYLYLIV